MGLARATRNLARTARANPMWALLGVLLAPFRFARHIVGVVLFAMALFAGLFLLLMLAIWYFALDKNGTLAQLAFIGIDLGVLLVMVWMFVLPLLRRFDYDDRADTHGSARFASAGEAQALNDDYGLLIGRDVKTGKPMRYAGPAHLLTIAPTRTGKGVGTIIPNLLEYPFAVVCIDPKGENARIAARQRGKFGAVHVLDPFGVTGLPSAAFNPLDRIDPHGLDLADDCMTLADALVHDAPGEAGEAHWNEEAKALIAGILLHIVTTEAPATRTLDTLRDRLTLAPAALAAQLAAMQTQGGLVARAANRQLGVIAESLSKRTLSVGRS
jgi:type IV secretion system protein VirD4